MQQFQSNMLLSARLYYHLKPGRQNNSVREDRIKQCNSDQKETELRVHYNRHFPSIYDRQQINLFSLHITEQANKLS